MPEQEIFVPRGTFNGVVQPFVYLGVQVLPVARGGWMTVIDGRVLVEDTEDDICAVIQAAHFGIENRILREEAASMPTGGSVVAGRSSSKSAMSGEGKRLPPARTPRRLIAPKAVQP